MQIHYESECIIDSPHLLDRHTNDRLACSSDVNGGELFHQCLG
jgi:hypothetical protein